LVARLRARRRARRGPAPLDGGARCRRRGTRPAAAAAAALVPLGAAGGRDGPARGGAGRLPDRGALTRRQPPISRAPSAASSAPTTTTAATTPSVRRNGSCR